MFAVGNVVMVLVDLKAHFNIRVAKVYALGLGGFKKGGPNKTLQINRAEFLITLSADPNRKCFAADTACIRCHRLLRHVVHTYPGKYTDLLDGRNTRNATQLINHRACQTTPVRDRHVNPIPGALNVDIVVQTCQQFADILPQVPHLLPANGFTLDGHFSGGAYKEFHKSDVCRVA